MTLVFTFNQDVRNKQVNFVVISEKYVIIWFSSLIVISLSYYFDHHSESYCREKDIDIAFAQDAIDEYKVRSYLVLVQV